MSREDARYTYTAGSRPEGVVVYDADSKLHSHHDTDPARGQHNAFDLVRLHRFGHLDKDAGELPITERPSYKAMCDFAHSLPELRAMRAQTEFEDLEQMPEPDTTAAIDKAMKPMLPTIRLASVRSDLRHATLPLPNFIWTPRIPRDGVTLLIGEDGLGKSWLALMIAMYCAAGKRLFDADIVQGPTCYVHAEDRLPMLERRMQTIMRDFTTEEEKRFLANFQHYDVAGDDVLLLTCRGGTPQPTPWVAAFEQQLGKRVLSVFDPLARLHDGPENDSTAMTRCLKMLEKIGIASGGGVLAPHHPNKAGTQQHRTDGTDSRGSGAIRAASRSQLRLIAANRQDVPSATNITDDDLTAQNVLILSQPKLSDGAKARPMILRRATDGTLAPFRVECGDPLQGLVAWFKTDNRGKPFTATRARNQRKHWGTMAEHPAEQFIAKQIEIGALVQEGTVKGFPAYAPSPATVERIAELDARVIQTADWMEDV